MGHVPNLRLEIYQGEDWRLEFELSGDNAPANFDNHEFFMELRQSPGSDVILRLIKGTGIEVEAGLPKGTVDITKEQTRVLPASELKTDFWMREPNGNERPLFRGDVGVEARYTRVEVTPE